MPSTILIYEKTYNELLKEIPVVYNLCKIGIATIIKTEQKHVTAHPESNDNPAATLAQDI